MMQKTATVYDVAAHAGVSIATVSRVFRRPADVRASTRERVLGSVRALGYVPSASARGLAARRTGVLGLYFPDFDEVEDVDDDPIADVGDAHDGNISDATGAHDGPVADASGTHDGPVADTADARNHFGPGRSAAVEVVIDMPDSGEGRRPNLYFDEVLRGSELQAWRDGFTLMVGVGRGANAVEIVADIAGRVDGLALLAGSVPDDVLEHVSRRIPIVLIAGARRDDDYDHVTVANTEGMHALTRHVIDDLGVRDAVYVSGPQNTPDDRERYEGYRRALAESGIHAESLPVYQGDFSRARGREIAAEILAAGHPPRALICSNDQMALGIMDVLQARGIRVPEDAIVTGFDGIEDGRMSSPRLTTVQQPMVRLGRAAMRVMRSRLDDPSQPPIAVRLPVKLLLRESSEGTPQAL
ncbi:MAG: LacI family DNA-binding transcriptional regulator [Microbacteriaceae bacterium]|nr:LacI family DNA-binding transcriptional regulator [Microbacteriaceae bacterium]